MGLARLGRQTWCRCSSSSRPLSSSARRARALAALLSSSCCRRSSSSARCLQARGGQCTAGLGAGGGGQVDSGHPPAPGSLLAQPLLLLGHLAVEPPAQLLQVPLLLLQLLLEAAEEGTAGHAAGTGEPCSAPAGPGRPATAQGTVPQHRLVWLPPSWHACGAAARLWVPVFTLGVPNSLWAPGTPQLCSDRGPRVLWGAGRGTPTAAGCARAPAGPAPPSPAPAAPAAPPPGARSAGPPARPPAAARPRAGCAASSPPACAWRSASGSRAPGLGAGAQRCRDPVLTLAAGGPGSTPAPGGREPRGEGAPVQEGQAPSVRDPLSTGRSHRTGGRSPDPT